MSSVVGVRSQRSWRPEWCGRTILSDEPSKWTDPPLGRTTRPARTIRRAGPAGDGELQVAERVEGVRGGGEEEEMAEVVMEAAGKEA